MADSPYGDYGTTNFRYWEASSYHKRKHDQAIERNRLAVDFFGGLIVVCLFLWGVQLLINWLVFIRFNFIFTMVLFVISFCCSA